MSAVCEVLGVARSNVAAQAGRGTVLSSAAVARLRLMWTSSPGSGP